MYFEAELKGTKYKLEVNETKTEWQVMIQKGKEEPEQYAIKKTDYTKFDDAVSFLVGGRSYMMDVVPTKDGMTLYTQGSYRDVKIFNDQMLLHESLKAAGGLAADSQIAASMPGKIVKLFVKPGDKVAAGQPVLIMEAMKMENEIKATHDVTVAEVRVKEGSSVDSGAVLVTFEVS